MLFRPDSRDFRLIGLYLGRVLFGVGLVMLVPLTLALALREWSDAAGFTIGAALAIAVGRGAELALFTREPLTTSRGVATVALSWFVAPVFAAVPLLLSGHWPTWLDAYFEAVSGLTATGLTVTNDLDHLSYSVNLWRHLMQFLGGQGIAIVVLTIFSSGASQVASLYTGEGREEKILPNVVRTVQFIWRVALVYAVIGTGLLVVALLAAGLVPTQALYHAVNVFMAAFDTGGFTPQSTSLAFYHSPIVEAVVMVLMVAGTFSFALHYQLWQGRQRDVARNLELRTMLPSILGLFALAAVGLVRAGTFTDTDLVFRHGFFQMLSAHTTTGFATVPAAHLASDWGAIAPGMMVVAMAIGGMAGSTSGGIKTLRVGLLAKSLRGEIRRVLLPSDAVVQETYFVLSPRTLQAPQVRDAATLLVLYLLLYLLGGLAGLFYGYELDLALFESTAAATNGGFTVGLARLGMEWPVTVTYILQMIVGRLEFVAFFALGGYLLSTMRGQA